MSNFNRFSRLPATFMMGWFALLFLLLLPGVGCKPTQKVTPAPADGEQLRKPPSVKLKFSAEIRRLHPNIWKQIQKYRNETILTCTEDSGNYICPVEDNVELYYDSRDGSFGFKFKVK